MNGYCWSCEELLIATDYCLSVHVGGYKEAGAAGIDAGGPVGVVLGVSRAEGVALMEGAGGIVIEDHGAVIDGIDLEKAARLCCYVCDSEG